MPLLLPLLLFPLPQDNLLPVSCRGQDWQGGIGLTLVDALDTLLVGGGGWGGFPGTLVVNSPTCTWQSVHACVQERGGGGGERGGVYVCVASTYPMTHP